MVRVYMFVYNAVTHDTRVLKEAQTLVDVGYQVTIYGILDRSNSKAEEIVAYGNTLPNIRIVRIGLNPIHKRLFNTLLYADSNASQQTISMSQAIEEKKLSIGFISQKFRNKLVRGVRFLMALLKRTIVKLITLIFPLLPRYLSFFDYYLQVYRLIKHAPTDIYHAHDLNTLPIAWWVSRRSVSKLVYDSHELYVERNRPNSISKLRKQLTAEVERFLIRRSDASITVNKSIAQELAQRYGVQQPTVVMNVPMYRKAQNIRIQSLRSELDIQASEKIIIYSGRVTFNRGLENLLRSLTMLPGHHLVYMGFVAQSYKETLLKLAIELEVESRFHFFGPVLSEAVVPHLQQADVGVAAIQNACLSYYYCSPNKLFEYFAAGIPVAVSNFPELSALVTKYKVGSTFDPENPQDIARAIRHILEDELTYQVMTERTQLVANDVTWAQQQEALLALYEDLEITSPERE